MTQCPLSLSPSTHCCCRTLCSTGLTLSLGPDQQSPWLLIIHSHCQTPTGPPDWDLSSGSLCPVPSPTPSLTLLCLFPSFRAKLTCLLLWAAVTFYCVLQWFFHMSFSFIELFAWDHRICFSLLNFSARMALTKSWANVDWMNKTSFIKCRGSLTLIFEACYTACTYFEFSAGAWRQSGVFHPLYWKKYDVSFFYILNNSHPPTPL